MGAEKEKEKAAKEAEKQRLKEENKAAGKAAGKENNEKSDEKKSKKRKADDTTDVVESTPIVKKAKLFDEIKAPIAKFKPSADVLKAMKADELNKKLWEEVTEKEYSNKKEMTEFVESQFCCIICQDVVFQPVTTPCFHNMQAMLGPQFQGRGVHLSLLQS